MDRLTAPSEILFSNKQTAALLEPHRETLLIRITDPNSRFISLKHKDKFVDILELRFYDSTPSGDFLTDCFFNIDFVDKILTFLQKNDKKYQTLLIHCDYGFSRSPGLALSIARHIFEHNQFVSDIESIPNIKPLSYIDHIFRQHLSGY